MRRCWSASSRRSRTGSIALSIPVALWMSSSYVPAIRDRGPAPPLESLRVRLGRGSLALESTVGLTSMFVAHGVRARSASAGIDKNRAFSSSSRQLGEQYETCMGEWLMSAATIWPTASGFASMRLIHPVRISIASVPVRRGSGGAYLFTRPFSALSRRRFCDHVGRRTRTRPRQRRVGPFAPELRRPSPSRLPTRRSPHGRHGRSARRRARGVRPGGPRPEAVDRQSPSRPSARRWSGRADGRLSRRLHRPPALSSVLVETAAPRRKRQRRELGRAATAPLLVLVEAAVSRG